MIDLLFLIIFVAVVLISYHYALRGHTQRAYWLGFWDGHAVAMEKAVIARRLEQIGGQDGMAICNND